MQDSLSLAKQTILITGVSRPLGIGAAIAKRLARAGARIIVHGYHRYDQDMAYKDSTQYYITQLAEELREENIYIDSLPPSDLMRPDEPKKMIARINRTFGKITGLVLNHAHSESQSLHAWTPENIDKHLLINVRASMMMIKYFAKQHDSTLQGAITLFTSGQYLGPMPQDIAYAVSKEAVRNLCSQASAALSPKNIRVNGINPGPTDTGYLTGKAHEAIRKQFPAGRWGTPEDAAKLVHYLHSPLSSWITGQTIASEGGFQR